MKRLLQSTPTHNNNRSVIVSIIRLKLGWDLIPQEAFKPSAIKLFRCHLGCYKAIITDRWYRCHSWGMRIYIPTCGNLSSHIITVISGYSTILLQIWNGRKLRMFSTEKKSISNQPNSIYIIELLSIVYLQKSTRPKTQSPPGKRQQ